MVAVPLPDTGELASWVTATWQLDTEADVELLRRGFNDTFVVRSGDDRFALRLYLDDKYYVAGPDDLRFELALLEHLDHAGLPVAPAIESAAGELLVHCDIAGRWAALLRWAPGEPPPAEARAELAETIGGLVGSVHAAADRFVTAFPRYQLDLTHLLAGPLRHIGAHVEIPAAARAALDTLGALVEDLGRDPPAFGIIHGDLHTGNLHLSGRELTLLDFDHSGFGWRAYDVATATWGLDDPAFATFVSAYEAASGRALTAKEIAALPALRTLRALWDTGDVLAMRPAWKLGPELTDDERGRLRSFVTELATEL